MGHVSSTAPVDLDAEYLPCVVCGAETGRSTLWRHMQGHAGQADLFERVLSLAVRYRAARVTCGAIVVEMHPSAFIVPDVRPAADDRDKCACGHSLAVEHRESGCLRGCSEETCAAVAS